MSNDLTKQLQQLWQQADQLATSPPVLLPQPTESFGGPASTSDEDLRSRLRNMWAGNTVTQVMAPPPTVAPEPAVQPVFVDIETRSVADISLGGRRYAYHPATEIVSVVAMLDSSVIVWAPGRADVVDAGDLWPANVMPKLPISIYVGEEIPTQLQQALQTERAFCAQRPWFRRPCLAGEGVACAAEVDRHAAAGPGGRAARWSR